MHNQGGSATKANRGGEALLDDLPPGCICLLDGVDWHRVERVAGEHCACSVHVEAQGAFHSQRRAHERHSQQKGHLQSAHHGDTAQLCALVIPQLHRIA